MQEFRRTSAFVNRKTTMNIIYTLTLIIPTLLIAEFGFAQLNSVWSYDFPPSQIEAANSLARDKFPKNFKFGVSTSSYQIEGAWNVSDKAMSIWDYVLNTYSEFSFDGSNGNVATDFYHKYKEDIQLAKSIGSNILRISISWTRLLPSGFTNHISADGVRFYNNVINELLANGITPMVTLFHSDTPYNIHRLGSFMNPLIIDLLTDYARVAFTLFGDRVKLWISINEPEAMCLYQNNEVSPLGYNRSGITEYECFRNSLLAHASVYHLYKRDFAPSQKGKIGFTSEIIWWLPQTDSERDMQAAYDGLKWYTNGMLDTVFSKEGNFPPVMIDRVNYLSYLQSLPKSRMPPFTDTEIRLIKGASDFLGINFYHARFAFPLSKEEFKRHHYSNDIGIHELYEIPTGYSLQESTPWALRPLFNYLKKVYDIPEIYITESGYRPDTEVQDLERALYYYDHLKAVLDLLKDGFHIKGFLLWTLTDNFAWHTGYRLKLGIFSIDFDNVTLPRTPKLSSKIVGSIFREKRIKPILEMLTEKEDIMAMQEFLQTSNLS